MAITFHDLWGNYPKNEYPCSTNGKRQFDDQCAIRVGVALTKCGYNITQLKPAGKLEFCWHHPKQDGHILRAEELANALHRTRIPSVSVTQKVNQARDFAIELRGKTGIIFFKDYWRRGTEAQPSGDHIDLWNGSNITDGALSYLRVQFGLHWEGRISDFRKSKEIWFWSVI